MSILTFQTMVKKYKEGDLDMENDSTVPPTFWCPDYYHVGDHIFVEEWSSAHLANGYAALMNELTGNLYCFFGTEESVKFPVFEVMPWFQTFLGLGLQSFVG